MTNIPDKEDQSDRITVAHIFYGQHGMLPLHDSAWQKSSSAKVRYAIIDDCSPKPITYAFKTQNLDIYRIKKDIPWNIAGARNLAFYSAQTDWVLCADVDHIVTPEALSAILELDRSDPNIAYTFSRRTLQGYVGVDAIINILMSKEKYFELGGHDEDFSGRYGKEETFFKNCLKSKGIKVIKRDEIFLEWHPKVGGTAGLLRDKTDNGVIYERKMGELKSKTYVNGPVIRFEWECVTPDGLPGKV